MGRKHTLRLTDRFAVNGSGATCNLQKRSLRRQVVQHLIDSGGKATLAQINAHFKVDMRSPVTGLLRAGWLIIEGEQQ
jgi:hypothetical protein